MFVLSSMKLVDSSWLKVTTQGEALCRKKINQWNPNQGSLKRIFQAEPSFKRMQCPKDIQRWRDKFFTYLAARTIHVGILILIARLRFLLASSSLYRLLPKCGIADVQWQASIPPRCCSCHQTPSSPFMAHCGYVGPMLHREPKGPLYT